MKLALLIIVVTCVSFSVGHNWMTSPSRVQGQANTNFPGPARTSLVPNVQIGRTQSMRIEWATGHGGYHWFVLVSAADEHLLKEHSYPYLESCIADYRAKGVSNRVNNHRRFHLDTPIWPRSSNGKAAKTSASPEFDRVVTGYTRPDRFLENAKLQSDSRPKTYFRLTNADVADDEVYLANNVRCPHIKAIWKYKTNRHDPWNVDFADITMPSGIPVGDYVIHWLWKGYYDIIDVNVVASNVAQPYGVEEDTVAFTRIDHCHFTNIKEDTYITADTYPLVGGSAAGNIAVCEGRTRCHAVQVIQHPLPNFIPTAFRNIARLPVPGFNLNSLPSGQISQVAQNLKLGVPTELNPLYVTTEDPLDPVFYGTCYKKDKVIRFNGIPTVTELASREKDIPWRFGDYCISCQDQAKIKAFPTFPPKWDLKTKCQNCDTHPKTYTKPTYSKLYDGDCNPGTCQQPAGTARNCLKNLIAAPRTSLRNPERDGCAYAVAADPECSDIFQMGRPDMTWQECKCWKKNCYGCECQRRNARAEVYRLG